MNVKRAISFGLNEHRFNAKSSNDNSSHRVRVGEWSGDQY